MVAAQAALDVSVSIRGSLLAVARFRRLLGFGREFVVLLLLQLEMVYACINRIDCYRRILATYHL